MVKMSGDKSVKAQSAMEYLMTYGWVILIIAIVLGVLFALGLFSPKSYGGSARPGACGIFRPDGAYTIPASIEGQCNGEVPAYVANFEGKQNLTTKTTIVPSTISQMTISLWLDPTQATQTSQLVGEATTPGCASGIFCIEYKNGAISFGNAGCGSISTSANAVPVGQWKSLAVVYNRGGTSYIYVNGQQSASGTISFCSNAQPFSIGGGDGNGDFYTGEMSNIQLYNTSISASDINLLYTEGIGAPPLLTQQLWGWWPLNQNGDDYSGDNQDMQGGVSFTGDWQSNYVTP